MENIGIENSNDFIYILDNVISRKEDLVKHHLDSMNNFYDHGLDWIISKGFNIKVDIINDREDTEEDKNTLKTSINVKMYNVKIESPEMINNDTLKTQKILPNHAHLSDLTYNGNLYVDVDIYVSVYKKNGIVEEKKYSEPHFFLSKIPIMVLSNKCNLYQVPKEILAKLNEDPSQIGAEFIIKGVNWIISNLESISMNTCRQFKNTGTNALHKTEVCRLDFISKPGDGYENSSHIVTKLLNKNQLVFEITNNRFKNIQIPFYILFRAFGVLSDKNIMESIIYKLDAKDDEIVDKMKNIVEQALMGKYKFMDNTRNIYSQTEILEQLSEYIYTNYVKTNVRASFNTRKYNAQAVLTILDNDILPHIGTTEDDRINKARFLGHMIHRLLLVHLEIAPETDRDSYGLKRVTTAGTAFAKFFKSQFNSYIVQKIQLKFIGAFKEKSVSDINILKTFKDSIASHEFNKALVTSIVTGDKEINVGGQTKPNPISSQQLHRKNTLNVTSVLRNINTNSFTNAKQSTRANVMRRVQPSMTGYICTVQSLDSIKVGVIKQMAISAMITLSSSSEFLKEFLLEDSDIIKLDENLTNKQIYDDNLAKVFVNGYWLGCCKNIYTLAKKLRNYRREQKINHETTIYTDIIFNELHFYTDTGRLIRPLIIVYRNGDHQYTKLTKKHLLGLKNKTLDIKDLLNDQVVEYISPDEQENLLLAPSYEEFLSNENNPYKRYTHIDIPQAQLGIPSLTSPMANNNQVARLVFYGNQAKQAVATPNLNFGYKTYKDQYIGVNNEYPLVKTCATKYNPAAGCNAITCIAIYEGYNQDDSLIVNRSAVDRGLFNCVKYSFVKTDIEKNEEIRRADKSDTMNIKSYYNYEKLFNGVIRKGTYVKKNDVIIGKISKLNKNDLVNSTLIYTDQSIIYKNAEPGYIWDIIRGKNEDGKEFIKVIYYQCRKTDLGDKFCMPDTNEVLTSNGWKTFKTLTMKDKICSLVDNKNIEYVDPVGIYHFDHSGDMISIQSQQICSTTTLNHKLYVKNRNKENYELIEAKNVYMKRVKFKKNGYKDGKNIKNIVLNGNIYDMNSYLQLLAMFIADGWLDKKYHNSNLIVLSFSKSRKIDLMKDVCKRLNLEINTLSYERKESKTSSVNFMDTKHYIKNIDIGQSFEKLNKGALNKFLPEFVWDLNTYQSRLLLETLIQYDGSIGKTYTEYYTSSKKLADDVSRLALHAGWSGNIIEENNINKIAIIGNRIIKKNANQFSVRIIKSKNSPIINHSHVKKQNGQKINIINYKGIVSCVEVPSHIFYVRENGVPHWTGNSSRSGQKGTVGMLYNETDMPFTKDGIVPDVIFSPMSLPTRMTMSVPFEGIISKYCAYKGIVRDGTIFKKLDKESIKKDLESIGFNSSGSEKMYNGMTGKFMDTEIFIAPIYYQTLQKFTNDSVYSHKVSPTDVISHQPIEGKSNNGGLKIGEMEAQVFSSGGSFKFLKEKLLDHSDKFDIYICGNCNKKATAVNEEYNIYKCNTCKNSAKIYKVPFGWSNKQFYDELEACNIGTKFELDINKTIMQ